MEFLLWCDSIKVPGSWREVEYQDDLVSRWQSGMLDGSATRSKTRISNETVNSRVTEACYFLAWAAERGYRGEFKVVVTSKGARNPSLVRKRGYASSRLGSLPQVKNLLSLPTKKALSDWHERLKVRHGAVIGLFAEFLIQTGVRISEGTGFRVGDLPEKNYGTDRNSWREDWVAAGEIPCTISMGIKGPKVSRGSLESVKPRQIYIPLELADRLEYYKKEGRLTLIMRWVSSGKDQAERNRRKEIAKTESFWIGKRGRPLTAGWVRQAWASVDCGPWKWSPHRARHEFAVSTIAKYTRETIEVAKLTTLPSVGWLHGLMAGQIQILLSPLLGHVDERTTMIYLKAARERMLAEFTHPAMLWLKECEE
ncbi:MAG: hypothetical protein ACN6PW_02820 [Pseudomonas kermanshahensis]|uniref:hypothetical protein n=1 Tax=Pseudomonas kermanshahensis TaxID=2745482 RepID=UPI003D0AE008